MTEELEKEATAYALEWGDKTDGTYACCRDGYLAGAEPREKRIAELEEKLANADYQLEGRDLEISELKAQIEKMKNCRNCANYMISDKCPRFFRTGWCKNWEITRSKK